jgi:hypothetical protein
MADGSQSSGVRQLVQGSQMSEVRQVADGSHLSELRHVVDGTQMAEVSHVVDGTQMSDGKTNPAASLASGGFGARVAWLALGVALGLVGAAWLGPRLPLRTAADANGQLITQATAGDCADTAMTYTLHKTRDTARAAFHCMSGFVVRGVTEDDFVQDAERYPTPIAGDIRRVGEFAAPDGQRMVYFAVVGPSQTVSYTIYLDKDGKVWRIG